MLSHMLKVGLTGGYASGKSFVAAELRRLGCRVIHADQLGHEVLLPGGAAYQPTVDLFGPAILAADGTIDRKALGALVFTSNDRLQKLNSIVHPAVFTLEEKLLAQFEAEDPQSIAVLEAAILIETGRYRFCDKLILTVCSLETQLARAIERDGLTREEALARIARQMPPEEKKRFADYLIDTGGEKSATLAQVHDVFADLKSLAGAVHV